MIYRNFRIGIIWRVGLLSLSICLLALFLSRMPEHFNFLSIGLILLLIGFQVINLIRYAEQVNKRLKQFMEAVRYSDFLLQFVPQQDLGRSFEEVYQSFDEVLERFKEARAEREAILQFLETLVRNVNTGLIAANDEGEINLINPIAQQMLGLNTKPINLDALSQKHPDFTSFIIQLSGNEGGSFEPFSGGQWAVKAAKMRLRNNSISLYAFHDISAEMEAKEGEAWQNLISVLRHEIMNAVAPMNTYISTLNHLVAEDVRPAADAYSLEATSYHELQRGLAALEDHIQGLMRFVDAYRSYTRMPEPILTEVSLTELVQQAVALLGEELKSHGIQLQLRGQLHNDRVKADEAQIKRVVINLIKNAEEALKEGEEKEIQIRLYATQQMVHFEIIDNGPGIKQEAKGKLFVPFFTTKKFGSGIGLSISRQIVQQHGGNLLLESSRPGRTVFLMSLPFSKE